MKRKVLTETAYDIPSGVNRWVDLGVTNYDKSKDIFVQIKHPTGFEDVELKALFKKGMPRVAVHKRIEGKLLHPARRVTLSVYQYVEEEKVEPVFKEQIPVNPKPIEKETSPGVIKSILSGNILPKDFKSMAVEKTRKRKERLTKVRTEVNEASALKPIGLDGKTIITGDDVDYSRGMALIEILRKMEEKWNIQQCIEKSSEKKLLYEFCDILSFSGVGQVISFYCALGEKTAGKGDLRYLSKWYRDELSKVFSPTSLGELKKKGTQFLNGIKPKNIRKKPNPGFSIKQAEKIISELFTDPITGNQFRMRDLEVEVYQPLFLDDEQTRVYTRAETPNARIVDVIVNTGLDPLYFQSKKIEIGNRPGDVEKLSLGPTRRSFDLPIAQNNSNITLVSIGSELTYQESEEGFEGMNPAQVAFLNKKKNYRLDWLDARKYMENHPNQVKYLRIEAGHLFGVVANSISQKDLDACVASAERSKHWSNVSKPALEWS